MTRLQHVNVVVPRGGTDAAVRFYVDILGLAPLAKPDVLRPDGAWLSVDGYAQLHLSERDGQPHPDSHFALVVDDFDSVLARLAAAGASWQDQEDVFGGRRGFTRDPAGNRIELLERSGALA